MGTKEEHSEVEHHLRSIQVSQWGVALNGRERGEQWCCSAGFTAASANLWGGVEVVAL